MQKINEKNISFKEIDLCDFAKLDKLYVQLCDAPNDCNEMRKIWEKEKDNDTYKLFGLYVNDELVGTATLSKCLDLTGSCKYYYNMENFVIDASKRRMGYGSYLLAKLEEYCISQNASYMNLTSSVTRTGAHLFYDANGYKLDYVKGFKKRFY